MRSLYARIFLTCCGTLFLALCAFLTISLSIGVDRSIRNFRHVFGLELSVAERVYREQGSEGLSAFLRSLDASFASRHYVVDRNGRDVVSGEDRSAMLVQRGRRAGLPRLARRLYRFVTDAESTSVVALPGGALTIVVVARPWSNARAQFPFYLSVLIIVSVLNALVAARIVSSLRAIARAADRFGEGNLEARVQSAARKDEVGLVAAAFNQMADRVRDLVLSERRLLQDVSHELRSPLARLAFALELARTNPDRETALGLVQSQAKTLENLVSSLLQVTRVSDGPWPDAVEDIALADLLAEVVATNALNAQEKRCRVLRIGTASPNVRGDRALLVRALDNLVRNAIEYSAPDSQVDITLSDEQGQAVMSVRDYGPGVPGNMLANIFEPFFRVDESRQASTGGVGLGLAIVRRAVHVHHGSVRADNAEPGLRVSISLPAAWSASEASSRSAA
jgi:two-component system sensor histidine kinase CpxA